MDEGRHHLDNGHLMESQHQQFDRKNSIWVKGAVINQLIRWAGGIRFADGLGQVSYDDKGIALTLDLDAITEEVEKRL
jgi:hypothetical protein